MNFREGMFLEKYFFLFHFDMTRCIPRREFYILLFISYLNSVVRRYKPFDSYYHHVTVILL